MDIVLALDKLKFEVRLGWQLGTMLTDKDRLGCVEVKVTFFCG